MAKKYPADRYQYYDGGIYDMTITGFMEQASMVGWIEKMRGEEIYSAASGEVVADPFTCFDAAYSWVIEQHETAETQHP